MGEYRDKESLFKDEKSKVGKNPIEVSDSAKMANMEDDKNPLAEGLKLGKPLVKGYQTLGKVQNLQNLADRGFGEGNQAYESVAKGSKSKAQHELETVSAQASTVSTGGDLAEEGIKQGITKVGVPLIMKGTGNVSHAVKATKAANTIGKVAGVAGDVAAVASIGSTVADLKHEGLREGFVAKETKQAQALDATSAAVGVGGSIAGMAGASAGGIGAAMAAGGTALAGGAGIGASVLAAGAALGPVGWAALGLMGAAAIMKKKGGDKYRLR
tara:strand:+ start:18324 stop:19136 length:813 start_codon:yes stop_codon:yes gene_type:complete